MNTVVAAPASLAFLAAGLGAPTQSVTVTQPGNGTFSLSTTNCGGIATVSPASGAGPFTFSALAAGTCSYSVTGAAGNTATIGIAVTTTSITPQ